MRKALIFQACFVAICAVSVFGLKGQQARKEMDIQRLEGRRGVEREEI
jgi:hypothetical protein